MLVLSMRDGEKIIITMPEGQIITIRMLRGGYSRLGFEAKPEVGIYREKVLRKIEKEKKNNE